MRRFPVIVVVAHLALAAGVGAAGDFDVDFTEEDVARAVEIAELRYGDPDADREHQRMRAAELFPPFDAQIYRRQLRSISDPMELRSAFLVLEGDREALDFVREARTYPRWMDADVVARLDELADEAPSRYHRVMCLRYAAAGHADNGDLEAAWSAIIDSMLAMPPDSTLVKAHDRLWKHFDAGRTPSEQSQLRFFRDPGRGYSSSTGTAEPPKCIPGLRSSCPVCRNAELAARIAVTRSLPESSSRGDRATEWLAATIAAARGFADPTDALLVEARGLKTVLGRGDVDPELRVKLTARLREVALALHDDLDGPRVAAEAADRCALVPGMENDAARLLSDVIVRGKPYPWEMQSAITWLEHIRPDLARSLFMELAARAPDDVPCLAMSGLGKLDPDADRARGWKIQLARGLCDAEHDRWNGAVEQARRELIKEYLEAGDTRRAFAVQALHHYRSFCGVGAMEASAGIVRGLAELQIAAGLDDRGAAQAYLLRADEGRSAGMR